MIGTGEPFGPTQECSLLDLVTGLPGDAWLFRDVEAAGEYVMEVGDVIRGRDPEAKTWQRIVRVQWNEAQDAAIIVPVERIAQDIDPAMTLLLHKSRVLRAL